MTNGEQQQPDTREPSDERKAELEAAYEAQKDTDAPYKDVKIRTLGEMQWIMAQRKWSGEHNLPSGLGRANFSGANFHESNLNGANFRESNLSGANFSYGSFSGAAFSRANLRGADLTSTDLHNISLRGANLTDALLNVAKLGGAALTRANLSGANLTRALLDAETILDGILIDVQTKVNGVR